MRKPASFAVAVVSLALAALIAAGAEPAKTPASLTFRPFGAGLPASGQWREGFRIADLNGDGHPDLVHGPPRKQLGPPVVYLGDGKGSWTPWKEARFPALPYDYGDVEVADFNRDGHPDIALAVHLHGILVLTSDGHGTFSNASAGLEFNAQGASGFSSRAIRATDWNGDGLPDLVAVGEGPMPSALRVAGRSGVAIFLNHGAEGWRRTEQTLSSGIFSDSLALGDFDGDGHTDVATGASVLGRKDLVNLWRANGGATSVAVDIPGINHYVQAVAAGDFDNDGKDDLAVAYLSLENEVWHSVTDVFLSRAGGKWERRTLSKEATRDGAVALGSGHLRSKSTRDLVALTARGETIVYLGDGRGGLVQNAGAIPVYGEGCRGTHVELADLDGDGLDEIVTAFADEDCPSGGGITAWKVAGQP